jgi:pyruvate/2-oxoglutarate dehydrogenase complex dihydrolipoamide acyltransferase (E2) component
VQQLQLVVQLPLLLCALQLQRVLLQRVQLVRQLVLELVVEVAEGQVVQVQQQVLALLVRYHSLLLRLLLGLLLGLALLLLLADLAALLPAHHQQQQQQERHHRSGSHSAGQRSHPSSLVQYPSLHLLKCCPKASDHLPARYVLLPWQQQQQRQDQHVIALSHAAAAFGRPAATTPANAPAGVPLPAGGPAAVAAAAAPAAAAAQNEAAHAAAAPASPVASAAAAQTQTLLLPLLRHEEPLYSLPTRQMTCSALGALAALLLQVQVVLALLQQQHYCCCQRHFQQFQQHQS